MGGGGGDGVVGIATGYRPDGSRFEPQGDNRLHLFHTGPALPWDSPSLLYSAYRVSVPGVKRPGLGVDHPPHLSPRFTLGGAVTLLPHCAFKEGDT
jgi:hypothetical protein